MRTIPQSNPPTEKGTATGRQRRTKGHTCRLEHLTNTENHRAGDKDTINIDAGKKDTTSIDRILLGSSADCTVVFAGCPTVSRLHAAIEWTDGQWVLVHLSKTNPTYLNGKAIGSSKQLQAGDIIELSANGPELRFYPLETPTIAPVPPEVRRYKLLILGILLLSAATAIGAFVFAIHHNKREAVEQYSKQYDKSEVFKCIYQLEAIGDSTSYGTGFVTSDGRLVTAYHVINVKNRQYVNVISNDKFRLYDSSLTYYDKDHDLAYYKLDTNTGGIPVWNGELKSLGGRDCCYYGYGHKKGSDRFCNPHVSKRMRVSSNQTRILFRTLPSKGDSGSPLLVKDGDTIKVAGIVTKKTIFEGEAVPITLMDN